MQFDRRTMLAGTAGAVLAMQAEPGLAAVPDNYAPLMRRVMGLRWRGLARLETSTIEGGALISTVVMSFSLSGDWTFQGQLLEAVQLDGQQYRSRSTIWGFCWVTNDIAGLTITRMRTDSGDRLPGNVAWGTSTGDFRFANDSDRPGHFALSGNMRNDSNGQLIKILMTDDT
jgi:hypothetical protein